MSTTKTKIITIERYSIDLCKRNPHTLFVFGDNLLGTGFRGQAVIRNQVNSFGIPTKRKPSISEDSFFSDKDEEYTIISERYEELLNIINSNLYEYIAFPKDGLGTGLADMKNKSPFLFNYLNFVLIGYKKGTI